MNKPWQAARAASKRRVHRRSVIAPVVCEFAEPTGDGAVPAVKRWGADGDFVPCSKCRYQVCHCDAKPAQPAAPPVSEVCPTCGYVGGPKYASDCATSLCSLEHLRHRAAWLAWQQQERLPAGWRREAGGDDKEYEHVSGAFVGTKHHAYGYCWCPGADDDIVDAKLWKPTREEAMATALGYKIARHGTRHEWHSAQASGFGFADAREAAMAALEYDAGQRGAG